MPDSQPGAIYRFFRGIWRALNFSRLLVFNVLFVFVLVMAAIAMHLAERDAQPATFGTLVKKKNATLLRAIRPPSIPAR